MNDVIKINYENERPTVMGRQLHEALEVETRYNDWFKRMTEYGFSEGTDFYSILSKTIDGGRPSTDHQLTIEMAKEICMLQRTEIGKKCRQYFLDLESKWNSPEQIMARALQISEQTIKQLSTKVAVQEQLIAEYEPKAQYVDEILKSIGTMTVTQIAADYGLTANGLNKILEEEHIQRKVNGQWVLYKEHMNNGYTKSKTIPIVRSDGREDTKMHTQFTQKGRLLIHNILEKRGIKANMDM